MFHISPNTVGTPIEEGSTIFLPDILRGLQIEFFLIQEPLRPPFIK